MTTTQKIGKTVGYICCCVHGYSFLNVYEVSGRENRNQKRRNFPKVIPCVYIFQNYMIAALINTGIFQKAIGRTKRPLHTFKTSSSKASSTKCHSILYTISIGVEKEATTFKYIILLLIQRRKKKDSIKPCFTHHGII